MEWILTDCFDTLLLRRCSTETVKRKWCKKLAAQLDYEIPYQKIYEIRRNAERVMPDNYSLHELYEKISDKLRDVLMFSGSNMRLPELRKLNNLMYSIELDCETDSLDVNTEQLDILKENTAKTAIISDMYCGAAFIHDLLERFDIASYVEKIFVSCDYKAQKIDINNSLYKIALDELKIKPSECLTYDDNDACIECAKRNKIQAIKVKSRLYKICKNDYKNAAQEMEEVFYRRYGALDSLENYTTIFFLFIERLYKQCKKDKIDTLFFLSREGEFLKVLFEKYCHMNGVEIRTEYLQVSRRAVINACLSFDPLHPGRVAERTIRYTSIENVLKNVGFTDKEVNFSRKIVGHDIDTKISDYWKSQKWITLCENKTFLEKYRSYVQSKKDILCQYLRQVGFINDKNNIAVVDVGWKGTMQDALSSFVNDIRPLYGYYIGLTEFAMNGSSSFKRGLVFSASEGNSEDYNIWSFYHTQMESILSASHAGVKSYEYSDVNTVIPIYQEWGTEELSYNMMRPYHNRIVENFSSIFKILENYGYDSEDFYLLFAKIYINTVLRIGYKKSVFLKKLQYNQVDNLVWGTSNSQSMIDTYNLLHNIKKILKNISTLNNPVRMIRILQTNKMHMLIPIFTNKIRKKYLKQIKYRKTRWDG